MGGRGASSGVCTRLFNIHRYSACNADLQPLPQALDGGILAALRADGIPDYLME